MHKRQRRVLFADDTNIYIKATNEDVLNQKINSYVAATDLFSRQLVSDKEERVVKRSYQNTAEGRRSVGRPRLMWMDDVREDLRRMGVTNWRICAHRRDDWKEVVMEDKVLEGL